MKRTCYRLCFVAVSSLIVSAVLAIGCKKSDSQPQQRKGTPPPVESKQSNVANVCAQGGGSVSDSASAAFFPRVFGEFCLDPHGQTRAYGSGADRQIDDICLEAFNGDCELYKSFGLDRVVLVRYVSNMGDSATIDVVLSKYSSTDGAYGMFTKRVISDADPMREDASKPMNVHAISALGTGVAYMTKGQLVLELTYTNDKQTPEQLEATARTVIPQLSDLIAKKLPGPATPPVAVLQLPTQNLIPLGISFEPKHAFNVQGAGAGAQGYYAENGKRYRIVSIVRNDADQAKDVLSSIAKKPGATRLKDIGDGAVRVVIGDDDSAKTEWIVARSAAQLFGVGDEATVTMATTASAKPEQVNLSKDDKIHKLRELIKTAKAPTQATAQPPAQTP